MNRIRRSAALASIAVAALGLSTACSDDAGRPPGNSAQAAGGPESKTLDGAKAAAQTVFDRFAGGDFAGAWDMYTAAGIARIKEMTGGLGAHSPAERLTARALGSTLPHDHDAARCVVGEFARDASQQEALDPGKASRSHDDEVGVLLLCHRDEYGGRIALARIGRHLDRRLLELATGAREDGFGCFAQVDPLAACCADESLAI